MNIFGGGLRRLSVLLGVGVESSGVFAGDGCGVFGWRLDARSCILDVKSRILLVVEDGVRRLRLPEVVSVTINRNRQY